MEIEKQRWMPLSDACVKAPGGFGWKKPLGSTQHDNWWDVMEIENHQFMFHATYRDDFVAGTWMQKSCTEYASYPDAWVPISATADTVGAYVDHGFAGQKGRLLEIGYNTLNAQQPFNVIVVPNYGAAQRAWWWGYGATAQNVTDVINGQAWGSFKADGIKKKIVSIDRAPSGHFMFVLNELQAGDAWWWGYGASIDNIASVINGQAWGNFKADGIKKRLVSLKRFAEGNWTFMMIPWEQGVGWWWFPSISWDDLVKQAGEHHARIIGLERYGSSDDLFSAILLSNK